MDEEEGEGSRVVERDGGGDPFGEGEGAGADDADGEGDEVVGEGPDEDGDVAGEGGGVELRADVGHEEGGEEHAHAEAGELLGGVGVEEAGLGGEDAVPDGEEDGGRGLEGRQKGDDHVGGHCRESVCCSMC